jgi:hypothetical protein
MILELARKKRVTRDSRNFRTFSGPGDLLRRKAPDPAP